MLTLARGQARQGYTGRSGKGTTGHADDQLQHFTPMTLAGMMDKRLANQLKPEPEKQTEDNSRPIATTCENSSCLEGHA